MTTVVILTGLGLTAACYALAWALTGERKKKKRRKP